jgi:hypothetical protein
MKKVIVIAVTMNQTQIDHIPREPDWADTKTLG